MLLLIFDLHDLTLTLKAPVQVLLMQRMILLRDAKMHCVSENCAGDQVNIQYFFPADRRIVHLCWVVDFVWCLAS